MNCVFTDDQLGGRQEEVRAAAALLFFDNGYKGTSLKQIANALGLQAPSLYNHIKSKQQLLQDIMLDGTLNLINDHDLAVAQTDDPLEKIHMAARAHIRHAARRRILAHVSMSELASVEEPAKSELTRLRIDYTLKWRSLIQVAVAAGSCATSHPTLTAMTIIDLGASVARSYDPDGKMSEDEVVDFYSEQALRLCGANTKTP